VARKRTSLLKAKSAKRRSKFAALSPVMVTTSRQLKIARVAINKQKRGRYYKTKTKNANKILF
jgi:hypothetical protein